MGHTGASGTGEKFDISVVISTYNRADLLPQALESVLRQEADEVAYEVIVVDNNSSDRTPQVVESFIARGHTHLRYVFEGRQGIPYGRNAGIANARAPIIAFADDDVRVAPDWVASIKRALDEHPEVDYVGGKVLPQWRREPPSWLTRDHWSPLALLDRGDTPFYVSAEYPCCLITANLSIRREACERVGLFSPDFLRCQDHELQLRLWHAGGRGLYVPGIVVFADVQNERLTKTYHRRWHRVHGKFCAMMRLNESIDRDGRLMRERPDVVTLFGVPGFVYRELIRSGWRWLKAAARGSESLSFRQANEVRHLISYIGKRYEKATAEGRHSHLAEVLAFAGALLRKKGLRLNAKRF